MELNKILAMNKQELEKVIDDTYSIINSLQRCISSYQDSVYTFNAELEILQGRYKELEVERYGKEETYED